MNWSERAETLAAHGDIAGGRELLNHGIDAGDVDAMAALAGWLLVGSLVPRDLAAARALLARAAAIGHVDAALMEVAFTANGSGGRPDWPAALRLLERAAVTDPLAAEQLALVRAMVLTPDGGPSQVPDGLSLSETPEVRRFPALFTRAECAHVATVAAALMEPSTIVDPETGRHRPDPVRTSEGAVIGPAREDLVIHALNRRIAAVTNTPLENGEPLIVLRYAPGQEYRLHHDGLPRAGNQRRWTMLVYLNQGYGGGETRFNAGGLTVRGQGGDGLLFRNADDDGAIDPASRHAGLPVTTGSKWLCTRWIRERAYDPWLAGV